MREAEERDKERKAHMQTEASEEHTPDMFRIGDVDNLSEIKSRGGDGLETSLVTPASIVTSPKNGSVDGQDVE